MSIQLRGLHPDLRPAAEWALQLANYYRIPVTITSVVRGWAEQTKLRARYEACLARGEKIYPGNPNASCRYPANEPGDSSHNYGLSWDSTVPKEHQATWDAIRMAAGFHVPPNDRIHAEFPNWRAAIPYVNIHR